MQPVLIGQQLRIGFIALKMIQKGDELFFNYHIKDKDIEWRNADAKKIGTTLQDGKCKNKEITYTYTLFKTV